ncbi:hypothetical protein C0993_009879 [Termitomyces sp. T159_Od127]|nr:hypothetical protein C0993_009879 [Termitomyces sp. T159_Od127]
MDDLVPAMVRRQHQAQPRVILMANGELPTAFDAATCVRKGLCPVTTLREQGPALLESHSLYYEQHGRGTKYKVVFIMGLNSSSFSWGPQVAHFGRSEEHTALVFDNRGVGNSGTAGMAEDAIALLDYLGWTAERELHVVGISLGGMIAQELASRIPRRIASLVLAVTTPGGKPWNNLPPDPAKKASIVSKMLFPASWLALKAADDAAGRTNHQVQNERFIRRVAITQPQRFVGHVSQMAAALTHHCSPERLRDIARAIPKVVILTGDDDNLVLPAHSLALQAAMPEAEYVQWAETGHGIHVQREERFNRLLERAFREGRERI